jgi:uncharacterized protein
MNPLYLLLIIPALLGWYARSLVRNVYDDYGKRPNRRGVTGADAARYLLAHYGLDHVALERADGRLTDHYDPQSKVLRLSDDVARGSSVTTLGIVAHEVGHAVQDAQGYRFMRVRTEAAERLSKAAQWSAFIFLGGMLFGLSLFMALGGALLGAMVIFSLITLPVERNASDRALTMLEQTGLAAPEESEGIKKVLRAAAFTYATALTQRLGTFLVFVVVIATTAGSSSGTARADILTFWS